VHPLIIVGLGNPGSEYENTRHNVGFMVIDELCGRFNRDITQGKGDYLCAVARMKLTTVVLLKPLTYMNNSGLAVVDALLRYGSSLANTLVIVDDLALPLGVIRVRAKGSDGGHNGLYSIIYHMNSNEFPRIRCGIKRETMPRKGKMADFVLSAFEPEEAETVGAMVHRAADAAMEFVRSGIAQTMNKFNL
jgi:peptidyl-tRNA hydrolase, PTH1 family